MCFGTRVYNVTVAHRGAQLGGGGKRRLQIIYKILYIEVYLSKHP